MSAAHAVAVVTYDGPVRHREWEVVVVTAPTLAAVARSILVIVRPLLNDPNARYHDLGSDFYAALRSRTRQAVPAGSP